MEYTYENVAFETRYIIAGRKNGCSACNNLNSFLEYGVNGSYDGKITKVFEEEHPEIYKRIVEKTGAMSLPIILDIKTNEHITGFNPPDVMTMLDGKE